MTKEEFELLSLCDGKTEIADSSLVESLVQRGMISACEVGAACLDPWQKMDCDNRYPLFSLVPKAQNLRRES